jgi:hypothetical protein
MQGIQNVMGINLKEIMFRKQIDNKAALLSAVNPIASQVQHKISSSIVKRC